MPRYVREPLFRDIEVIENRVTTRSGTIGEETPEEESVEVFVGPHAARFEYDKTIASYVADGYARTDVPPQPLSDEALEADIAEAPEDVQGYLVYADWLLTRSDPRGELISIQHALQEHQAQFKTQTRALFSKRTQELRRADYLLQHRYREHFFGPELAAIDSVEGQLYSIDRFEFEWFCGFVRSATLANRPQDGGAEPSRRLWKQLFQTHSVRFLRSIQMHANDLAALNDVPTPPTLNRVEANFGWGAPERWFECGLFFGAGVEIYAFPFVRSPQDFLVQLSGAEWTGQVRRLELKRPNGRITPTMVAAATAALENLEAFVLQDYMASAKDQVALQARGPVIFE